MQRAVYFCPISPVETPCLLYLQLLSGLCPEFADSLVSVAEFSVRGPSAASYVVRSYTHFQTQRTVHSDFRISFFGSLFDKSQWNEGPL